jgi:hypothetical protein
MKRKVFLGFVFKRILFFSNTTNSKLFTSSFRTPMFFFEGIVDGKKWKWENFNAVDNFCQLYRYQNTKSKDILSL